MSKRIQKATAADPLPPVGRVVGPNTWEIAVGDTYTVQVIVGDVGGVPAATAMTLSSPTKAVTHTAWRLAHPHQHAVDAIQALSEAAYASSVSVGFNLGHVISDVERDGNGDPVLGPDGMARAQSRYSPDAPPSVWWEARERYWSKVRARLDQQAQVPKGTRPGAGRPRLDNDHFRAVAEAYLEAFEHKYSVHRHIAKCLRPHEQVNTATVKRWIAEAEGRGFLSEAQPGKPRTAGVML
jgi:hypothetical protein